MANKVVISTQGIAGPAGNFAIDNVNSNIEPESTGLYNLGSSTKKFAQLHASGAANVGTVVSSETSNAPMTVNSTALVANLNADKLDGADLSTTTALGTSDTLVPSQNAVKTYVDGANVDQVDGCDVSTNTSLGTSNSLIPTQNAVKTYVDSSTSLGEANVQVDFNETVTTSDAFIKNKPTVMGSGNSYAAGLVLAGSGTHSGTFLRKDGTWVDPLSAGSVGTSQIANGAVTTDKISDSDVTSGKLGSGAVTTVKIADSNVTTGKIADANITTAKIADAQVTTAKIVDANVTTAKLATDAVTTAKITDLNVTTGKIAGDAVTQAKIANNAVGTDQIAGSSVTYAKLQDLATMKVLGRTSAGSGDAQELTLHDEDNMSSDSATGLATQQSIKAYVDANAGAGTVTGLSDTTITGTPADNEILAYDNSSSKWINQTAAEAGVQATIGDGDLTIARTSGLQSALDAKLANVSEDTTPQLGGNLDVNGNDIVSTSNANIDLDPNGSGKVVFKGNATKGAGQFVLNCENNSHGITIKGPPHSAAASYTLTLPNDDGSNNQALLTNGSGVLSWGNVDSLPSQSSQSGKYLTTDGSSASWATVSALPSQSSNANKVLTTDGTNASWSEFEGSIISQTFAASKTIPSGSSMVIAGPVTVASGQTLTVSGTMKII